MENIAIAILQCDEDRRLGSALRNLCLNKLPISTKDKFLTPQKGLFIFKSLFQKHRFHWMEVITLL